MLTAVVWFIAALGLTFAINLVPGFMPSTWMVLAFFNVKFHLPLLPLAVCGAIVSGFGRAGLYAGSQFLTRKVFKKKRDKLLALGDYLRKHENVLPAVT